MCHLSNWQHQQGRVCVHVCLAPAAHQLDLIRTIIDTDHFHPVKKCFVVLRERQVFMKTLVRASIVLSQSAQECRRTQTEYQHQIYCNGGPEKLDPRCTPTSSRARKGRSPPPSPRPGADQGTRNRVILGQRRSGCSHTSLLRN